MMDTNLYSENIRRYFNVSVPVSTCNLRCSYCYLARHYDDYKYQGQSKLKYTFDHMSRCSTIERLGGRCLFNLCGGGETIMFNGITDLVKMFLDLGHFVSVCTNATLTKPLNKLCKLEDRKRLFVKCSFHYLELKEKGFLEIFASNVKMLKMSGIAYSVELIASDECISVIDEIMQFCLKEFGALCHVAEARDEGIQGYYRLTKLPLEEHQKIWSEFNSPFFTYGQKVFGTKINSKCMAGRYSCHLDIETGDLYPCDAFSECGNLFENSESEIMFEPVLDNCHQEHCYSFHTYEILCGCYDRGLNAPVYADIRDRICTDGTSWLTPEIRAAYSKRCCEFS